MNDVNFLTYFIIQYSLFVVLGGLMVLCDLYKKSKDRIKNFKSMYPGKSKDEYYQMALEEFKNDFKYDYDKVYEGALGIFVPFVNIFLTMVLFIGCVNEYLSELKVWGNLGEKYKKLYFWINKKMIEINLKGEKND